MNGRQSWSGARLVPCLGAFLLGSLSAGIARAETWRCEPQRATICEAGQCRPAGQPTVWVLVDFTASTYSRCDAKGCDTYPLTGNASGIYLNGGFAPGSLFKATLDGKEFIEIVTLGLQTINYWGTCHVD